ncbi:hypothetical protein JW916_01015 [Candidatus Sumerlaeota bacterium]|nr:hypothetical protein [Candidatus Sumerlaeota bacterium]
MDETPTLPPVPAAFAGRYHRLLYPGWTGWIDRSLHSTASRPWLERPRDLLEQSAVRWFKRGRNLLAEVRWPEEGGTERSGTGVSPVSSHERDAHATLESGTGVSPVFLHERDAHATAHPTVVLKEFGSLGFAGLVRNAIRPPRAVRAWDRAFALIERGFNTSRPLWLLLPVGKAVGAPSYLAVETAPPHARLREVLGQIRKGANEVDLGGGRRLEADAFLAILARYVRAMHDAGVWHRDFSGGNLLIPHTWRAAESQDENVRSARDSWVLIDVNRARLTSAPDGVRPGHRIQDLERISLPADRREAFYAAYALGNAALEAAQSLYLRRARLYRRLRETHNPALRLWRKIFTYWIRV